MKKYNFFKYGKVLEVWFFLFDFKVCFLFLGCLDLIKLLGREKIGWRLCFIIYSYFKNNICLFNEYSNFFEIIIRGKFWNRNEWFFLEFLSVVNRDVLLVDCWFYFYIWV